MKPGDLVKRKGEDWYAIVKSVREAWPIKNKGKEGPVQFIEIMWCDGDAIGDVESCAASIMEIISEI